MNTLTINNNILLDDQLISLIKSNFNKDDMQLFDLNYKIYTTNKNNLNDFIVDFDEVWKWIGYNKKSDAKKVLINIKSLVENKDYKVLRQAPQNLGGRPSELILLTINCFKKFCLKASTQQSEKIYDYYIKMEDIITKYIENKNNEIIENNKKLLQLKDIETNQMLLLKNQEIEDNKNRLQLKDIETNQMLLLKDNEIENNKNILELKNEEIENNKMLLEDTLIKLQLKDQEIEDYKNRKYEEIEKDKFVYIFSSDKPNMYKIGKTKDVLVRQKQLQTSNVDDIIILHTRSTSDDSLLEKIVHYILDSYRYKSNREYFAAKLDYIKFIIDIAEVFLDTLKSSYEYITKDELLQKINENLENQLIELNNQPIKKINENLENQLIDSSNKPIKKLNKKNIISINNESKILPITDNINEDNIIEINDDIELPCSSEHIIFNFDNDIIDWFKLNYELTNNKNDTIKVKDIYEFFTKSTHYENMTKIERKKYNKSYLINFIEKNKFFIPYYVSVSRLLRTFIKCWKLKVDINIITTN